MSSARTPKGKTAPRRRISRIKRNSLELPSSLFFVALLRDVVLSTASHRANRGGIQTGVVTVARQFSRRSLQRSTGHGYGQTKLFNLFLHQLDTRTQNNQSAATFSRERAVDDAPSRREKFSTVLSLREFFSFITILAERSGP